MGIYVSQSKHHASDVALACNPHTQLLSPQYHVIFYKEFATIGSADPQQIKQNINNMFENLFDDNKWIHNDEFIDPNSNKSKCSFDFSWDIIRIYKNLHTCKCQLARQLVQAVQNNALLWKQLGLPKYLASKPTDPATTVSEGVLVSVHKEAPI
jgi:hypothetical protein